ncbi:MAG: RluA family pseudouridine synthase [Candidatus Glassbacteria bacterium]|nr:RluA family pseudouridine synthase [Candidatus Glassbacteria bacterium]
MENPESVHYTASGDDEGKRLDVLLAAVLGVSRSRISALARKRLIAGPGGKALKPSHVVTCGETFTLPRPDPVPRGNTLDPQEIPLDIVFEDEHLLVVNKPAGMVVHPAPGHRDGTLANALAAHFRRGMDSRLDPLRPGIVHRLDKDTSGLLMVAKTFDAHEQLAAQIRNRSASRIYLALCLGHWAAQEGAIEAALDRSRRDRKKMAVDTKGRVAITNYRVIESYRATELVEVSLRTGRTHQIRVHFAHSGHPVLGDPSYGGRSSALKGLDPRSRGPMQQALAILPRQALHAARLVFAHPASGEKLDFSAPLPQDFQRVLELLRRDSGMDGAAEPEA